MSLPTNNPNASKDLFQNMLNRQQKEEPIPNAAKPLNPGNLQRPLSPPVARTMPSSGPSANSPLNPRPSVNQVPVQRMNQNMAGPRPMPASPQPNAQRPSLPNAPQQKIPSMPQQQMVSKPAVGNTAAPMHPMAGNIANPLLSKERQQGDSKKFVDFQSFQEEKEKMKKQQEILSKGHIANAVPGSRQPISKAKKYQDHRLGKGIPIALEEEAQEIEEQEPSMPDRRSVPVEKPAYQDHKLGDALSSPLPKNAGKGYKYQDHRLGPGIKQ
ncbi:MAG: hypothetical protein HUU50_21600 [Candidatus Brocadiae bacterium]|nr:hypothetical protein [Candidatus Brocadiia bacterium]